MLVAPAVKISADTESLMSMASVNGDMKFLSSHIPPIFFFSFVQVFLAAKKTEEFQGSLESKISGNRGALKLAQFPLEI